MDTQRTSKTSYQEFASLFFPIFIPIAARNIINSMVSIADVLMLGRLSDVVLSGASFATQFGLIPLLTLSGFVSGVSILVAQYWGRNDRRTIERIIAVALRFSFLVSGGFFLVAALVPDVLIGLYTLDQQVIAEGARYLRLVCPTYLVLAFTEVYFSSLSATGHVAISTVSKFAAVVTNLILNYLLIYGKCGFPALGAVGAAIATVCARIVELLIAVSYAARNRIVRIRIKDIFRFHGVLEKDVLHYSIPTMINDVIWSVGYNMTGGIVGHLGVSVTAAYSVACQVREFMLVFSYGTASTAAIIIGNILGSGDLALAKDYGSKLVKIGSLIGCGAGLAVYLSRNLISGIVNLPLESTEYLLYLHRIMAFFTVLQAFTTLINLGLFRAGGDPKFALYLDFIAMWGINVGLGMLGAYVLQLPLQVILIVIMADEAVKAPILYWRYRKNIWIRNITRDEISVP